MTAAKGKGSPFWSITVTCSCPDAAVWACGKDPAKGIPGLLQAGAEQNSNRANEQNFAFDNIVTANDEPGRRQPSVVLGEVCKTATIVCDARSQSTVCVGREPHTSRPPLVDGQRDYRMRPMRRSAPSYFPAESGTLPCHELPAFAACHRALLRRTDLHTIAHKQRRAPGTPGLAPRRG